MRAYDPPLNRVENNILREKRYNLQKKIQYFYYYNRLQTERRGVSKQTDMNVKGSDKRPQYKEEKNYALVYIYMLHCQPAR